VSLLVILLILILVFSVLVIVPRKAGRVRRTSAAARDGIDDEVLEEAEEELGRLRSDAAPEDADDELPDWGPGAPKY
jgi:hypothetical protein